MTPFATVARHAETIPDQAALTFGDARWSYADLAEQAGRVAGGLRDIGLRRGDRLAVLAGNRPEVALAWLAGSRSGVLPCLLNNRLTPAEFAALFARLQPRALVVDWDRLPLVIESCGLATLHPPLVVLDDDVDTSGATARWSDVAASTMFTGPAPPADDVFEITFTSGTTSQTKMVALTHGGEVEHWGAVGRNLRLDRDDTVVVATPLFHSSGIRNACFVMWTAGGCVALLDGFSPRNFWRQSVATGGTWSCLVETMLSLLLLQPADTGERPPPMRFVVGGGALETIEAFELRTGIRVLQAYGMTECGMAAVTRPDLDDQRISELRHRHPGAMLAGSPTDGTRIRAATADGTDAGPGTPGELVVQGPGLLAGYIDDSAATAGALPDGWLRTGDLGTVDRDGTVYFIDRLRDVIRRGGENIASKEVEAVLDAHPAVLRSAVYPVPDPIWVQEVSATVVPRPGGVRVEDLWRWCEQRLAGCKVPRYLDVCPELPTTATGRVNKAQLRSSPITPTTRDRRVDITVRDDPGA
ncbi:MAG TPA: class I adenylate-forming enzyme family protein [Streptosporangiaceae bacterium]|nr:class I adenylate-forming enzyme family protein [Streptosporangiaceae bacterium]